MITSKLGEHDITDAILYFLIYEKARGNHSVSTTEAKEFVRNFLNPVGINLTPLVNRNDEAIDQIVRNIVSHRYDSQNNIINQGYIVYDDGMWSITNKGAQYFNQRLKLRFERELNS